MFNDKFVLRFDSLEEFAKFIALIRNTDLGNDKHLRKITEGLKKHTDAVENALKTVPKTGEEDAKSEP